MSRPITLIIAALSLSACVSLLPAGEDLAPRLALDPDFGSGLSGEPLGVTLSIADPRAEAVFDTSNVAIQTAPLQYKYLSDAEWTDRAPRLLGTFLERRIDNSGRFTAVGDRVALPVADFTLHTDIRALNIDATDQRQAVVSYGARLTNRRGATLGTKVFRAEAPLSGEGSGAAATALNEAAARTADEAIEWAVPLIEADTEAERERAQERADRRRGRS